MRFRSKLPDVGTTIFTVMSKRALDEGALNIGQGFPDYPIDEHLANLVTEALAQGHNQYAPMEGAVELRVEIARKLEASYAASIDPVNEITITCDPAYDAYEPAVRLAGGRCVRLALQPPDFS